MWPGARVFFVSGLAFAMLSAILLEGGRGELHLFSNVLKVGLLNIWLPAMVFSVFQSLLVGGNTMNLKRGFVTASALSAFIFAGSTLSFFIRVLGAAISTEEAILLGTSLAASFNALVYRYMTGRSLTVTGIISIAWPIFTLISMRLLGNLVLTSIDFIKISTIIIVTFTPAVIITASIDKLCEKLVGMSSKSIFRAYVMNMLTGSRKDLEDVFNRVGTSSEVACNVIHAVKKDGQPHGVILVPHVHPGPLKNTGSSSLPSDITSAVETTCSVRAIPFHGFVTHASDITSTHEYRRFLEAVVREACEPIPTSRPTYGCSSKLLRIEAGGLSIGCQIIGGIPFVFVSGSEIGVKDIPEKLRIEVEKEVEEKYKVNPILINAHNSYEEDPHVNLKYLKEKILEAIDLAFKCSSADTVKVGIGGAGVTPPDRSYGLGDAGIRVLLVECMDLRYCYVVIDANNSQKEFRRYLRSALLSLGYSDCELFTTDNHSIVHLKGVGTKRGYHILGEKIRFNDLYRPLFTALREAEESLCEASIVSRTVRMQTHVLGDVGYKNIERLMDRAVHKFRVVGPLSYAFAMLASALVCVLI